MVMHTEHLINAAKQLVYDAVSAQAVAEKLHDDPKNEDHRNELLSFLEHVHMHARNMEGLLSKAE